MAMTANGLRDAIKTEFTTQFGTPTTEEDAAWDKICQALGDAIIDYVSTNADVRIKTTDSALQRDDASTNDTLGPGSDKVLSGALE